METLSIVLLAIFVYLIQGCVCGYFLIHNVNKDVEEGKYKRDKYGPDYVIMIASLLLWPVALISSSIHSIKKHKT